MEENKKKALRLQAERKAQAQSKLQPQPLRVSGSLSTGKGGAVVIDAAALGRAEQILNRAPAK